jgi:hypothetical protein
MPIVGWSSNIQTIQASTEYASNSKSDNTASDATSFAYGPSGSNIPNGAVGTAYIRRVRFLTKIQQTDVFDLVTDEASGTRWVSMASRLGPRLYQGTVVYGPEIVIVNDYDVDITFHGGGFAASGATYGANGSAWSAVTTWKWRLGKRSGLAAGEVPPTVYAHYQSAAASVLANATIIQWDTKVEDTHNAVTTGAAWKFTAPIAGLYELTCMTESTYGSWVFGNSIIFHALVNGNSKPYFGVYSINAVPVIYSHGSIVVRLSAGDYLQVKAYTGLTTTMYLNDAELNWIKITRIGG